MNTKEEEVEAFNRIAKEIFRDEESGSEENDVEEQKKLKCFCWCDYPVCIVLTV